jgi:hypothetical protein
MSLVQYFDTDYSSVKQWVLYIILFFIVVIAVYALYNKYMEQKNNKLRKELNNIMMQNVVEAAYGKDPEPYGPDLAIITDTIHGVPKRPEYITGSMVVPGNTGTTEEKKRSTRMLQYNLEYDNQVDDNLDIGNRPTGLFSIP